MIMNKAKERNSNIELLRIVAMFMIVISHYTVHNGVVNSALPLGFNRFLLEITDLGNIGVIIFVLITGYYNINSLKPFKLKRLFSMILQVFFYSAIIYLIFVLTGQEQFSFTGLIKNFLPITFVRYWFASAYILLYIFIPYINLFLRKINKGQHLSLVLILVLIFSVLPTITGQKFFGNELIFMMMSYTIGAYLGRFKNNFFSKKRNSWVVLLTCGIVLIVSIITFDLLGLWISMFGEHSAYLLYRHTIISALIAISVFSIFSAKKPFSNAVVNTVAGCMFGVYLISDNPLVRRVIWIDVLKVPYYVNEPILALHMMGSVLLVFVICIGVDYVRQKTLEKGLFIIYDKIIEKTKRRVKLQLCQNDQIAAFIKSIKELY